MTRLRLSLPLQALALALILTVATSIPMPADAQTSTTAQYVENATGNTKAAIGTTPALGTLWTFAPPSGGYLNSTSVIAIHAAAGAGISNIVTGGECWSEALGTATEIVLMDGATVIWRMKIPTTGWPGLIADINFVPYIKGTANTAMNFQGLTASGTGAIYCNWRGGTDK